MDQACRRVQDVQPRLGGDPAVQALAELTDDERAKIALFTNVPKEAVITALDAKNSIYDIPMMLHDEDLDDIVIERLGLEDRATRPAASSLSASSLNDQSGAKTPLASLTTGALLVLTLLLLAPVFSELPLPVLADWARTRAYAVGINGLYLNLEGREAGGVVRPGAEARRLADELVRALQDEKDPATGRPVVARAYRREEIYRGRCAASAPRSASPSWWPRIPRSWPCSRISSWSSPPSASRTRRSGCTETASRR